MYFKFSYQDDKDGILNIVLFSVCTQKIICIIIINILLTIEPQNSGPDFSGFSESVSKVSSKVNTAWKTLTVSKIIYSYYNTYHTV